MQGGVHERDERKFAGQVRGALADREARVEPDAADGYPAISYCDVTTEDLKFAIYY